MRFRKIASAALLLAASMYILIPTADELLIHPAVGLLLVSAFEIPFTYAIALSIAVYRTIGLSCLLVAVWISGKPIQQTLKDMRSKIRLRTKAA